MIRELTGQDLGFLVQETCSLASTIGGWCADCLDLKRPARRDPQSPLQAILRKEACSVETTFGSWCAECSDLKRPARRDAQCFHVKPPLARRYVRWRMSLVAGVQIAET